MSYKCLWLMPPRLWQFVTAATLRPKAVAGADSPIRQHQAEQLSPSLEGAPTAPFQDTRPLPVAALPHSVLELEPDLWASCLYAIKSSNSAFLAFPAPTCSALIWAALDPYPGQQPLQRILLPLRDPPTPTTKGLLAPHSREARL